MLWPGSTVIDRIELRPMMLPLPRSAMPGAKARTQVKAARRLSPITRSNSSEV